MTEIIQLGRHRIMLGDCNNPDHVAELLGDTKPDIIITDPPYLTTDLDFDKQFDKKSYIKMLKDAMKETTWLFMFSPFQFIAPFLHEFRLKFDYVWIKSSIIPKTHVTIKPYAKHETIFALVNQNLKRMTALYFDPILLRTKGEPYVMNRKCGATMSEFLTKERRMKPNSTYNKTNDGYREGSDVLHFPNKLKSHERTKHPTQKPQALIELLLNGYCKKDGLVFDPTLGSGTTLMAAEKTGRTCYGMEINPKYFEMILERYRNPTKLPAEQMRL